MATYHYGLLDQTDEGNLFGLHTRWISNSRNVDAFHKSRLLTIEEKPFKRITKRLLAPDSLIYAPPNSLPTPPPDASAADEAAAAVEAEREKQAELRRQWREDMLLDFAALEDSMVRIQLLSNSNEKERERYAAEKLRIMETAQAIRENTAELRIQLEEAQNTLELRKSYDKLAEKITSNQTLKPRAEQEAALEKLNTEIAELGQESREYSKTWAERRIQFGKIVEEGREMLRLIRDEKEEAERKEGMEADDDEVDGTQTKGHASTIGTPRPDGSTTPMHMPEEDPSGTSRLNAQDRLKPMGSPYSKSSRGMSPARSDAPRVEIEDTDMMESTVTTADPADSDEKEEGEEIEEGEEEEGLLEEKMDVS